MLFLLRHAPTRWNAEKKIQGRTDIPLSADGRTALQALRPHPDWYKLNSHCSPLRRTVQTAALLGYDNPELTDALIETNWGEFEGLTVAEIDRAIEQRGIEPGNGLDLLPPAGESPRMVADRLQAWISGLGPGNHIGVTHKGVIRAALFLASGWDMQAPYPDTVDWRLPVGFQSVPDGRLQLTGLNLPWDQPPPIPRSTTTP